MHRLRSVSVKRLLYEHIHLAQPSHWSLRQRHMGATVWLGLWVKGERGFGTFKASRAAQVVDAGEGFQV